MTIKFAPAMKPPNVWPVCAVASKASGMRWWCRGGIVCEGYEIPRDKYLTKTPTLGFGSGKMPRPRYNNRMERIKIYLDNCTYNRPFDTLIKEPFDYTEWSRKHYEGLDLHEFNMKAIEYDRNNPIISK
jgi:hypothetical protein